MRIKRMMIVPLLALLLCPALLADGGDAFPYALDPVKDSAWIAGGLGLFGTSVYLDSVRPLADSSGLDAAKIPWFDKAYTIKHSAALNTTTDVLVVAFTALPAAALPGLSARQMLTLGTIYSETIGLAYSADAAIKSVVVRNRPYAYSSPPPSDIGSVDISSSFPSLHSTIAFASAVFAGSVFDELHPDSPYRAAVWGAGLGVATLVSALRVASGDHFVSDVAAGAALGTLIGFGVPYLHRVGAGAGGSGAKGLSLSPSGAGLIVNYRFAP